MRRAVVSTLVVLAAVALVQSVPGEIRYLRSAWPILRLWPDGAAQRRAQLGAELHETLIAADAAIPKSSSVLLVTAGVSPRQREYEVFHRTLYHLAPRPMWWMNPALPDTTWEARWWISAPLDASAVKATALARNAAFVLFYKAPVPPALGRSIHLSSAADLVALDGRGTVEQAYVSETGSRGTRVIGVIVAVAIVIVAGLLVAGAVALAGFRIGLIEALGLAWPLGGGVVSIAMLSATAGLELDSARVAIAIVIAGAATIAVIRWRARVRQMFITEGARGESTHASVTCVLLAVVIAGVVSWVAIMAVGRPLTVWDSWVNWGMKARILAEQAGESDSPVRTILSDSSRVVAQLDYPLLVPFLEAWTFRWASAIDDRLAGIQAALFFVSVPLLCYALSRRFLLNRQHASIIAAIAASIPGLAGLGGLVLPDLTLAIYALIASGYVVVWLREGTPGALLVAALAGGLMPWTKREGAVLLTAMILALALCRDGRGRWWRAGFYLALSGAAIAGPWYALAWNHGVHNPAFQPVSLDTFRAGVDRLPSIAARALLSMTGNAWNYVWFTALIVAGLRFRRRTSAEDLLPLSAVLYIVVMAFSYVFSAVVPYQQHVLASIDRVIAHVVLLPLIWIGCGERVSASTNRFHGGLEVRFKARDDVVPAESRRP
jgi:hypothetical protein